MDPLSDVLSLLRPNTSISVGLEAGGDWSIAFPAPDGIKFNAVMRGACWVAVEGVAEPLRLEAGDCFLLTQARPFRLASDLSLPAIEPGPVYAKTCNGVATLNSGAGFYLIGGRFAFEGGNARVLFDALPPIVHARSSSDQAAVLRWGLDLLASELRDGRPGGHLIAEHLAQLMLVQVLRLYLDDRPAHGTGWFHALADRQIGRALGAIHAEPARRWTLAELANAVGLSRSAFAQRFRQLVGVSPLAYLTRWRMLVAGDRLRRSDETVASIAYAVGYESESAFSTAFRRTMSASPRQYRRELPSAPTAD